MRLNDAMVAMQDDNTVLDVLTGCQCYFSKIEEISGVLANGEVNSTIDCRKVLSEATSIYLDLNPLLALAESEKSNRELKFYVEMKREVEKKGEKFVATSADKEASLHVANYRRVRNILESYVEAVKIAINTCQSILRSMTDEARMIPSAQ